MEKPVKYPKTFRITAETMEILSHTAEQAGYRSHTALMEEAIYHYCSYLINHITIKKEGTTPQ